MSLHNLSILWLWTLRPVMWLPRSGPRSGWDSMNHATSVFSLPLSERTLDGRPNLLTADWNASKTVLALLFVEQLRNTIIREKPSIPPCMTNLHLKSNAHFVKQKPFKVALKVGWFSKSCEEFFLLYL